MAFPQTVLPLAIELNLGGTWLDLVALGHVYRRGIVNISRGRSDEASQVDRSTLTFQLDNRSGDYSPRNPNSQYYGVLGRNTPIRVSLEGDATYLATEGFSGDEATAPDTAATSVVGDIDIRVDVTLSNWRELNGSAFAGKYNTAGDQRSWAFYLSGGIAGELGYSWSTAGTLATTVAVTSTKPLPAPASGRMSVRVTHDVNDGAGDNVVRFYHADSMSGPWIQLGDPVTSAGTTSIFNSTAELEVGDSVNLSNWPLSGRVHKFELRNGIDGTVVANPDFTTQTPGDTSFADTASPANTWTLAGFTSISNKIYRFHGEVAAWPQRWDLTGTDVYVPVEAAGVLRRLGQSGDALQSVLYRGHIFDSTNLVAYWPMEDVAGSTQIAAALDTHQPLAITGSPVLADYSDLLSSDPLPKLNGASYSSMVPAYSVGTQTQVRFVLVVPAGGAETGQTLLMFYTTGSVRRWELNYGTGGTLTLIGYDGGGTQLFTSGPATFDVDGKQLLVSIELEQAGANINWNILTLEPGESSGLTFAGTLTSDTIGKIGIITVSPGGGIADVVIGHLAVQNTITTLFELGEQLNAWFGETAGRRIERLCREGGVAFRAIGDLDDTVTLGPQRPDALLALIREAVAVDMGLLYEPREVFGLGYRARTSLCNQQPRLTLDYSAHELASSPNPTDDDQSTINDITVSRLQGSSARSVLEAGILSVQAPPNGVGRYTRSESVSIKHDLMLSDQANWRLRLGTVDEARYPQLQLNLAHPAFSQHATLPGEAKSLEVGDRIVITNLPSSQPPDDASMLVQGYVEVLGNFEHDLIVNCSPASPYDAGVYGSGNLTTNGHFETDLTGWVAMSNSAVARTTAQQYAGTASIQVTKTAPSPAFEIHGPQCTGVDRGAVAGKLVAIEFYARIPSAVFSKVTGLAIGAVGIPATFISKPSVADTWVHCVLPATVLTASLDDIQIQFWTDGTIAVGATVAYLDAFSIRLMDDSDQIDRYQPEESTLATSLTATATAMSVATPLGPLWTTDDNEFPFDIFVGGERMTVVDIAGTTSPQTFTVLRSRNGVVKTQAFGALVELMRKTVYGL